MECGDTSIMELFLSCILKIQPERSEQTPDGMKWNLEWLDFYDFLKCAKNILESSTPSVAVLIGYFAMEHKANQL